MEQSMIVRALKLKDHDFANQWDQTVENRWNYDDMLADEHWRKDWISFDGVVYHPDSDCVYCGITSFDADIFKAWDRKQEKYIDLGFSSVADPYDAKFHRSMQITRDGQSLYTATALLHDVDRFGDAPGGGVFKFDVAAGTTAKLGIPIPHVYIQSIALDEERELIYALHFTPERLSVFDLKTNTARDLGAISSGMFMAQGENIQLDDQGCAWCGWGLTRAWQSHYGPDAARLCKYDPQQDRIIFYQTGLPRRDGQYGFTKVEGLFNLGVGCLHASGDNGSLYRINTDTGEATYMGTPIPDRPSRLANLVMHTDGFAYGITGRNGQCQLLKFDPKQDTWELGSAIVDDNSVAMYQCHDLSITPDGVIYAGENDVPHRSGYLWEIKGAI
jgi:hypothetical protein